MALFDEFLTYRPAARLALIDGQMVLAIGHRRGEDYRSVVDPSWYYDCFSRHPGPSHPLRNITIIRGVFKLNAGSIVLGDSGPTARYHERKANWGSGGKAYQLQYRSTTYADPREGLIFLDECGKPYCPPKCLVIHRRQGRDSEWKRWTDDYDYSAIRVVL